MPFIAHFLTKQSAKCLIRPTKKMQQKCKIANKIIFFLQGGHIQQQQNGMMSGGPPMGSMGHPQGHPQPQASPLDSQGGHSPTSSNTSQTPQTTPTSSSSTNREVPKLCNRPGCQNQVQRGPDGWTNDFCSNECVVGQCREVYTSWSSGSQPPGAPSGPPGTQGGPQPGPPPQQAYQQQVAPTAVVK